MHSGEENEDENEPQHTQSEEFYLLDKKKMILFYAIIFFNSLQSTSYAKHGYRFLYIS